MDADRQQRVFDDQFRNPHPRNLGGHTRKIVAWIYREHLTGRLKTQFIDDWTTPFEVRRRYSRNGFEEIAAFSYRAAPSAEGNTRVYAAWLATMMADGPGTDDRFYGWLSETATVEKVVWSYRMAGPMELPLTRTTCPASVKMTYNKS